MLRSVLVALDESPFSESATTLAMDWAARFGASLLGLGILDAPAITGPELVPIGARAFKLRSDKARLAHAHTHVLRFLAKFQNRCRAAGIPAEVTEDVGDPADCIMRQAQRCDVVILGRETHFQFETQQEPDKTLARVLRASPRPVVVVPKETTTGNGVVVAYGGGREVARTLQTFQLLGLDGGEMVHLINVRSNDKDAAAFTDSAARFLESHGTPYQKHDLKSNLNPAEVLLEQVRVLQPRLLVMGAQGHHPLRDLFATSVTRAVLRECPVPVLIGA